MFENGYFILGILNNLLLISVFLTVKFGDAKKLKAAGTAYLLLAAPAVGGIIAAFILGKPAQYSVFLAIFIAFLILDGLYDFILKIDFRKKPKLLIPFLTLYWSANYGFFIMVWKHSKIQGGVILGLFVIQLAANVLSHTGKKT